jgi:hypothetical protein
VALDALAAELDGLVDLALERAQVITGSSRPVGRMICSTTNGVPRLVGSKFSTGSALPLGVTRNFRRLAGMCLPAASLVAGM